MQNIFHFSFCFSLHFVMEICSSRIERRLVLAAELRASSSSRLHEEGKRVSERERARESRSASFYDMRLWPLLSNRMESGLLCSDCFSTKQKSLIQLNSNCALMYRT